MRIFSRRVLVSLFITIFLFCISNHVYASVTDSYTHKKSSYLVPFAKNNYNATLYYHYLGDNIAYCMQWDYATQNNVTYKRYNETRVSDYNKYAIAKAIQLVNADTSLTEDKKYTYASWIINCYFNTPGHSCHSSWNGYQTYVDKANDALKQMNLCSGTNTSGCFNSEKFKLNLVNNNYTLNKIGTTSNYISDKITLSGMLESYGGTGTSYKIEIECPSGSTCKICEDAKGTKGCESNKTLNNRSANYDFYLKVETGKENSNVKVKASGTNSSSYPYIYTYTHNSATQNLALIDNISVKRDVNKTLNLTIPSDDKHTATVTKVDENGDDLTGATFSIYRADGNGNRLKTLVTNTNGSSTATAEISEIDNWDSYNYCLEETKSPQGYILTPEDKKPFCIKPTLGTSSSTCYLTENQTEVDQSFCGTYSYYCQVSSDTLNTNTCRRELDSSSEEPKLCEEGYEYDDTPESDTYKKCVSTAEDMETEAKDTKTSTCENGTLVEGTCYICSESDNFDSQTKKCVHEEAAKCKNDSGGDVNTSYCQNRDKYELVNISGTGNISFVRMNRKNSVTISKTDITGEKELAGAEMKICTTKPDKDLNCTVATINDQKLIWHSEGTPKTWRGLDTNTTYYLVETVAPLGYKITQYTTFTISDDGTVKSEDTVVTDGKILVKNDINKITVSKQDLKTNTELSGAKLHLCIMAEDENGGFSVVKPESGNGCVVPSLNDGSIAEWTSGSEPLVLSGLDAGTYLLEEISAPKDYDLADDLIFTLKQDGIIVDEDGNPIKNNFLIMYDTKPEQVKTGGITIVIATSLAIITLGIGLLYYRKRRLSKKSL